MAADGRRKELAAQISKRRQGAGLVRTHEARVAHHVSSQNRRQPALRSLGHGLQFSRGPAKQKLRTKAPEDGGLLSFKMPECGALRAVAFNPLEGQLLEKFIEGIVAQT